MLHDLPLAFNYADEIAVIGDGGLKIKALPNEIIESGMITATFGVNVSPSENGYLYCPKC